MNRWKTRYFVLQNTVLEYFENVGFIIAIIHLSNNSLSAAVLTWDRSISLALKSVDNKSKLVRMTRMLTDTRSSLSNNRRREQHLRDTFFVRPAMQNVMTGLTFWFEMWLPHIVRLSPRSQDLPALDIRMEKSLIHKAIPRSIQADHRLARVYRVIKDRLETRQSTEWEDKDIRMLKLRRELLNGMAMVVKVVPHLVA
jgi:hypothetical protein